MRTSPPPELPQPNWKAAPSLSDYVTSGIGTLGKLAFPSKSEPWDEKINTAIKALQDSHKDFYDRLGQLPKTDYGKQPADYDAYRKGIRGSESAYDDSAVNPTTNATGRYQFLPSTAKALIPDLDLATLKNPDVQEKLMKLYTDKSVETLTPMLGRKPTAGELYMLHFLGHSGGPKVLQNLDAPITETIGEAERRANANFLKPYKTGRDLLAGLNSKFGA